MTRSHHPGVKIEAHAVVRHDTWVEDITEAIYVVEVLPTREEAEAEIERLNRVSEMKRSRYFYSPTRWYPTGRSLAR